MLNYLQLQQLPTQLPYNSKAKRLCLVIEFCGFVKEKLVICGNFGVTFLLYIDEKIVQCNFLVFTLTKLFFFILIMFVHLDQYLNTAMNLAVLEARPVRWTILGGIVHHYFGLT